MNYTIKRYFNGIEEEQAQASHKINNHDVLDIIDHAVARNNKQIINQTDHSDHYASSSLDQLTYESKER